MKKELVFGIIRHILTFLGGFLILKGYVEESFVEEAIGSVTTLVGLVWSLVIKVKTDKNEKNQKTE